MRHGRYHHGDLRAALLVQAEQRLRERGASGLSLRELARDLDVSPGAPGRHFESKQELLAALVLRGYERLDRVTASAIATAGESFAERVDAAARAYVDFAVADPDLLALMFAAKHDVAPSPELAAAAHAWFERMLEVIDEGQRRGEVKAGDRERVALPVFAALHGFAMLVVSRSLPPELAAAGLDDVIVAAVQGSAAV
ncbi:TetR/AcrR family transcriptional regulator [Microbacterium jejuense]|uniref:TetR/AcrR family transcriptional regulator n=1 Tax=Microbacterium jejuense TaxID=1263637 RepID=UPI0031E5EC12